MAEIAAGGRGPPAGAFSIFLSSTVGDYEALRREVREALQRKAECSCSLSEDWPGGYNPTVQECEIRVRDSQGFILLLGHWYGSIPPGHDKSITHLEFEWAFAKWKDDRAPSMAVLRPKPGSEADTQLRTDAIPLIAAGKEQEHALLLQSFHSQVDDKEHAWRRIQTFQDRHDLRETAIVLGTKWRGFTPLAAARGEVPAPQSPVEAQIREDQFGQLGRKTQHDAIKKALSGMAAYPEAPALVLLVHGDEDAGQRSFVAHVARSLLKRYSPKRAIGRLPPGSNSTQALVTWIASILGLPNTAGIDTPELLAERVVEELEKQQLHFIIEHVGSDYAGGLQAFLENFWRPFWTKLRELRLARQISNRLVAIVTDYAQDENSWSGAISSLGAAVDFTKLIPVPRLRPFVKDDFFEWFDDMDIPDRPAGRRDQLATRALPGGDGTPLRVFSRLGSEQLDPEGEQP